MVTPQEHPKKSRDPIYGFIEMDAEERRVMDSQPLQRLRHIHQLGVASMVYLSATHMRLEHSLGVMELAGRVYDTITHRGKIHQKVKAHVEPILPSTSQEHDYWRRVVRMAALCHDIGHTPF